MSRSVKVFSPATVANVGPGYDILGFALENIGDIAEARIVKTKGIHIQMPGSDITTDPRTNVAGVAIQAMMDELEIDKGIEISITKKIKPGSGMGSSASSAAAAVYALNELIDVPLSRKELVKFAMAGEEAASGKPHADNVAPALLGGFTLVRSYTPLDVITLNYPKELVAVIVHPHIEVKTSDSKLILPKAIPIDQAIMQWANVGGLVAGLANSDYDLIGRSLVDYIIEPVRSMFIPQFDELKSSALKNGALGCSISGSGPSVFALCPELDIAKAISNSFSKLLKEIELDHDIYISKINPEGVKTLGS